MEFSNRKIVREINTLTTGAVQARRDAARRLGRKGSQQAIESLSLALQHPDQKDPDRFVRRNAALSLGMIGDSAAVDALLNALSDKSGGVRKHAILALGAIGDPRAIQPLCEQLSRKSPDVRPAVIRSLASFGASAVVPLCTMLKAPRLKVRQAAHQSLILMVEQKTPEVQLKLLANAELSPSERYEYLDTLLNCYTEPFSLFSLGRRRQHLSSVRLFCEYVLHPANAAGQPAQEGAKALLDYLSLGRPSQRNPSAGTEWLLRPVQGAVPRGGADTLLRASERETVDPPERETLLVKIKRWFGMD
jgi:hypothetical protein